MSSGIRETPDVIKQVNVPSDFFDFKELFEAFEAFHTFEIADFILPECPTCKEKNTFIDYVCHCPFCKTYNDEMSDISVTEYVLHCYMCHKCLCKANPYSCNGCALIYALMTGNSKFIRDHF